MSNGVVKDIVKVMPETAAKDGEKYILTETSADGENALLFAEVKSRNGGFVRYYGPQGAKKYFTILEDQNIRCV